MRVFGSAPEIEVRMEKVAVLPIERDVAALPDALAPGAERIVTAHVYGALTESSHWRIVPDLAVREALESISTVLTPEDRAQELADAVDADAVIFGTVWRFVERKGSDYGADRPASVAFKLKAVSRQTGEVVWEREFNETQEPLTTNLLNIWQFWRGGPRWFTAAQFTELGVDRLIEDLEARTQ